MQIAVNDAKGRLLDLVRRAEKGEEVVLTRHGKAIARLVGLSPGVIVVDTSALLTVLLNESQAGRCILAMGAEVPLVISAGTLAEAMIVAGRHRARPALEPGSPLLFVGNDFAKTDVIAA